MDDVSGGTPAVVLGLLQRPWALLQALISPPGATLGFVLALTLPLLFVPLLSVDAALLVAVPLLIALVSQGRTALAVTLRYVLALVPGLYLGAVLWWQRHPDLWSSRWLRRSWTAALSLGLVLTLLGNPHRSLSALIPDSFVPWVHVPAPAMWERQAAAVEAVALVPAQASVAADTPLLPLLAQREAVIRFPKHTRYRDRQGAVQSGTGSWRFRGTTHLWLQCSSGSATSSGRSAESSGRCTAPAAIAWCIAARGRWFCSGRLTQRQTGAPALTRPIPVPGLIEQVALYRSL